MALRLFLHALRMVTGNLGAALRISALLVAVQLLLALSAGQSAPDAMPTGAQMLSGLAQLAISLWIAVAWHRHILLEETPGAALPRLDGGALGRYAIAALILTVILVTVAVPFVFLTGLLVVPFMLGGAPVAGVVVGFIAIWLPVTYVSLRLAPILVSAAVGQRMAVREAWYATGTGGGALLGLSMIGAAAGLLVSLPGMLGTGPLAMALGVVGNWLVLMVGTSLLTTIHGHYVQGRDLA